MGDLTFLPSAPTHFWIAWTDVHPLRGYDQDLSEVQAQASFNFSVATLSLSWRNGPPRGHCATRQRLEGQPRLPSRSDRPAIYSSAATGA